jgi:CRAL/TRIO domain
MRDWIMENPRILKCRMDSKFILRFLRFRKFRIPEAKEALERYLVFREGLFGMDYLKEMDYKRGVTEDLLEKGMAIILPKPDKYGRKMLMFRLGVCDTDVETIVVDAFRLVGLVAEILLEEEENQLRGFVYILDLSGIRIRHYFLLSFTLWFKIFKNLEVRIAQAFM